MSQPEPAGGQRPLRRLIPVADQHVSASTLMILSAASQARRQGAVLVLGAGECQEIPLSWLCAQFERVVLNDYDAAPLERAIASAQLTTEQRSKLIVFTTDLIGAGQQLADALAEAILWSSDPHAATQRVDDLCVQFTPAAPRFGEQFDLIIASCLLTQLHVLPIKRAAEALAQRFPQLAGSALNETIWPATARQFASRIESWFISQLAHWLSPEGRVFLSETITVCFFEAHGEHWQTPGAYRIVTPEGLQQQVQPHFEIVEKRRWPWVRWNADAIGQRGRVFDVEGYVLKPPTV